MKKLLSIVAIIFATTFLASCNTGGPTPLDERIGTASGITAPIVEEVDEVEDNVIIQDNVKIEGYCETGVSNHLSKGEKLVIGKSSYIRSHSIFYEGSTFGDKLITGHRVIVREQVHAGMNLQIGSLSDIQGHSEIGDYVRFHSNVHVGQKAKIGNFVWIFPYP